MRVKSPNDGDCFFHALKTCLDAAGYSFLSSKSLRRVFLSRSSLLEFQNFNKLSFDELLYMLLIDCSNEEQDFIHTVLKSKTCKLSRLAHALCSYMHEKPNIWASGGIIALVSFGLSKMNVTLRIKNSPGPLNNRPSKRNNKQMVTLLYNGSHYDAIVPDEFNDVYADA